MTSSIININDKLSKELQSHSSHHIVDNMR